MRQLPSLAALAVCVIYANADATSEYIESFAWPVNIVAPKMHLVAPSSSLAAPYCNLSLGQAIARALYMDEVPAQTTTPAPPVASETDIRDTATTTMLATGSEAAYGEGFFGTEVPAAVFEKEAAGVETMAILEDNFAFLSDVYEYIDGQNTRVPSASTSALPLYLDANATPEAKIRLLITTVALQSLNSSTLRSHIKTHASLKSEPEEQKKFVKAIMERSIESESSEKTSSVLTGDNLMDQIPETMVGFLSSRVLTELLSNLVADSWGQSIIHDANDQSITDAVCRAATMGKKNDFLPEVTICTLITLLVNFLGCSYSAVKVSCDNSPLLKYELANCELLPEEMTSAEVIDLKLLDSVDEAVDPTTFTLTDAGRETEGPTLYALQIAQNLWSQACGQRWCQSPAVTDKTFITELIPGWPIVREVWLAEENSSAESDTPTKYSPFTAIAQKKNTGDSCEFLVINRGSGTNWEWFMNLSMRLTILPQLENSKARGHEAYFALANSIVQVINEHLIENFSSGECAREKTTIWFHGHSLGGGQTNMQSLLLADYWSSNGEELNVKSVAMASMRIFNSVAGELHKKLVNARNMHFNYDMVPSIGCLTTGIPRCNPKYWSATMNGEGEDEAVVENAGLIKLHGGRDFMYAPRLEGETTNITQTLNFYHDQRFLFVPVDWLLFKASKDLYVNIPTSVQMGTAHGCSYQCFVSRNFCSVDPAKQMACVRKPVNIEAQTNCYNNSPMFPSMWGTTEDRTASLDCTPEYWGYDKLPDFNETDPFANYNASLPYFCHAAIPGVGPSTLMALVG